VLDTGAAGCGTRNLVTQGVLSPSRAQSADGRRVVPAGWIETPRLPTNRAAWARHAQPRVPFSDFDGPDWHPVKPPRIRLDKQTSLTAHTRHALAHAKVKRKLRCQTAFPLLAFLSHP
jgi:hypothetical protein